MARKINRRFWFNLHGWFSLPVWVVFAFVCITGTISVLSHEITWLTNSDARATNPQQEAVKPMGDIIAAVQDAYPSADVSWVMTREPYLTYAVNFTDVGKPSATAYVNQYTGEVQEVFQGFTFIGFMRALHGWLLFPWHHNFSVGYYLVSAMAFVMLGALVTGLVVYKKFWRAFFKPQLRVNKGVRIFLQDAHRFSGVWSMWFLLLMSLTGLWYLVQAILWHNHVEIEPHAPVLSNDVVPGYQASAPNFSVDVDTAIDLAKQEFADFSPTFVMLPEHSRGTYKLAGSGDYVFFDNYSYQLSVNPWQPQVEASMQPSNMNALQTLVHIADPLHYGTIGGLWTKIIWFIFGLILSGMSIAGFFIWRLRLVALKKEKANKNTEQTIHAQEVN
ncbi:PepSY-associated TM helix domain-containing protein [Bermanella sp. R86510]|uniref:PepSY-associated TM helix domain-containing protein n=1 Tax=unclassified Bermanella TaxID=2627862 RepID=UPI0037C7B31D